jgi:uncharacterized protein YukE
MSQAIVDPAELRRFANTLRHFCGEVQTQMGAMKGQLNALSETWRDQEHEKFAAEFEQTLFVLGKFVETSQQHVPFLLRKAEKIEEYLQQR